MFALATTALPVFARRLILPALTGSGSV